MRITTSLGLMVLTGLMICFVGADEGRGQPKAAKKAAAVVKQEFNGREADVLRNAYVLLNAANGTYDGHRMKAMNKVREACEILDKRILANGNNLQEAAALQKDAVAAYLKSARKQAGPVTEAQNVSNARLYYAGQLLSGLHTVMVQNKQPKLAGLVKDAYEEIVLALKS